MSPNFASVISSGSKLKKDLICSVLTICTHYLFNKILFDVNIFELLGGKAVVIFNVSDFLDISLGKYIERLGVMVFFSSLYVLFQGLYALFFSSELFFGKELGFSKAAAGVKSRGVVVVFTLFLFKMLQVFVWALIILSIDGNRSVLDNFALFSVFIVGSFVLGEMILSSIFSFRFMLSFICNKGRFMWL
ncbi:hypothetical protein [Methylomonas methanica]|uniref:Uncharacterized protein n=1 Tax=Methylomonas methanica TaxID=421 RepID=A0A177MQB5_METMH|nr:hypothetical protein [Methylomonas methanica]OAI07997.1 hypothetical protein A1332_00965 [Methylomonas methanica]